jgi:hypothetical protein
MAVGAKAWVVRWARSPGSSSLDVGNGGVLAILPPRWTEDHVGEVLERLLWEHTASLGELVEWRDRRAAPYRAFRAGKQGHGGPGHGRLLCGDNPMLEATYVEQLRALDEDTLEWIEKDPLHRKGVCELLGYPDCPLADAKPAERRVRAEALRPSSS